MKSESAGKLTFTVLKEAAKEFSKDKATRWAAAVSYYAVFSLAPLLMIAIAVAGYFFGEKAARGEISTQLTNVMGEQGAKAVESMLQSAQGGGSSASIIGIIGLIFAASAIFMVLKDAMNQMFEVPLESAGGVKNLVIKRVLSFVLVLLIGALVIASLAASAIIMNLAKMTSNIVPATEALIGGLDFIVLSLLLGLVFGVLIKLLPDTKIDWPHALKGGMITGLLFSIGKYGIAFYLAHKSLDSSFGAAGSLVMIMLWVYFSAIIFFFGAEITHVLWRHDMQATEPAKAQEHEERRELRQREA